MVKHIIRALWLGLAFHAVLSVIDLADTYLLIKMKEIQVYERSVILQEHEFNLRYPPAKTNEEMKI